MADYSAMSEATKWLTGRNDWTAPTPGVPTSGFGAAPGITTPGYNTEEMYQRQLAQKTYYAQHPEEFAQLSPEYQAELGRPVAPPEANPYQAQLNLTRTYANPLLAQMQQAANGQGPSQAQDTLREGTARTASMMTGSALTPSVGGAQQAALMANAQMQGAQAQQQGARQAAQLRAQEMTDARQQLGGMIGQTGNQFATTAKMDLERQKANQEGQMSINQLNQKTGEENKGGVGGFIGGILGALSDIQAKEDIVPMEPSRFRSTIPEAAYFGNPAMAGQAPRGYAMGADPAYDEMDGNRLAPAADDKKGGLLGGDTGKGLGVLGAGFSAMSDEHSKERIRELEGALDESRRTASAITGTRVPYPDSYLNLHNGPPPARFEDVNPSNNGGTLASRLPRISKEIGIPPQQAAQIMTGAYPESEALGRSAGTVAPSLLVRSKEIGLSPKDTAELMTTGGSRSALAPIAPYEYRYKPEYAAALGEDRSPRVGVMAQDLEQSPNPALRSAVVDTPMGKAIDGKRALSANLALSAGLDKRLRNIEVGLGRPVQYPNLQR